MSGNKEGIIVILSSPSGAGKTTLVKEISKRNNFHISISHTTRKPRLNEIDGKDYYFVRESDFKRLIDEDKFLEYAKVFNHYYGSSEDIVFTLEDIIEILSLSHDIYIRVYRDPSLPWVNSASYTKQLRLRGVSLIDFATIGLATHSIMEPCKISIDAATEFLDSASVTNPSKNTRMIRILEKSSSNWFALSTASLVLGPN